MVFSLGVSIYTHDITRRPDHCFHPAIASSYGRYVADKRIDNRAFVYLLSIFRKRCSDAAEELFHELYESKIKQN
jgi:hypothetical protein